MELQDAIAGRRSVRAYTAAPVGKESIEALIAAAIAAPNAVNEQPWHFTVVRNAALLDRISAEAKAHMQKLMAGSRFPHHLHGPIHEADFHIFYHAPALVVISTREGDWQKENAALAAENLMLAAHAAGLGSCWIGFAQRWFETAAGKAALGLPEGYAPVAPIILGHPREVPPPVPRSPPRLHWLD